MGAKTSDLRDEEICELQQSCPFSKEELRRLYQKFRSLDKDTDGSINTEEFSLILPELAKNPLLIRLITISQQHHHSQNIVDFKRFINNLSVLSKKTNTPEKLKLMFQIYDIDGDGFVSREDLFSVSKMIINGPHTEGVYLTDEQLYSIVDKTIRDALNDKLTASDTTSGGKLDFPQFQQVLADNEYESRISICI